MTKRRPKTGEERKTHLPLKIDLLPQAVRDAIQTLYDRGATWKEIEERSVLAYSPNWATDGKGFVNWEALDLPVLERFPDMRLAKSTLHLWFDLRVRQVREQMLAESAKAREFAAALAKGNLPETNAAVLNALRDLVFNVMQSGGLGDKIRFEKSLKDLTLAMTRIQRVELQAKRVDAELAKIDAERAKLAAEAGDPREIYLLASQDLLKKLRTREQVRAVIDPIKEDLIQEFTHGAEAFAKQIEASAA
jgi:hypothetical protein